MHRSIMKNRVFLVVLFLLGLNFSGCLVFQKVSYSIKLKDRQSGSVTFNMYDIKSDAIGNKEFEEDKHALFEYFLKSSDFIDEQKFEGKFITSRKIFIDGEKLNATVTFDFDDIRNVEGILYQDGLYFLTLDLKDSVLSTNGQVIYSGQVKRIIWDDSQNELNFVMLSDAQQGKFRDLKPFFKED